MSLVWLRSTSVYALIFSHCKRKFHSLWSVLSVAEKKFKHDEGHDVETLPIMGTTTALRPGELWQLLAGSSTFRFAAQARRSTNQELGERNRPTRGQVQGNYDCGQDVTG